MPSRLYGIVPLENERPMWAFFVASLLAKMPDLRGE